ncbi:hypothetical protein [Halobellus rubicundus]|uniref:DUF8048 domain-containing protein n=1 Tax=Halobellus rubicundus TaxID=2996466 RepID=A0ABD5M6C4_9EURY
MIGDGAPRGGDEPEDADSEGPTVPLDGDVLLYAGATASVAPGQLGPLLRRVQAALGGRIDRYRRAYECVADDGARAVFLCPEGHWAELGAELELTDKEAEAAERAHAQQLRRIGTEQGRRDELETALEIREAVVIGRDEGAKE